MSGASATEMMHLLPETPCTFPLSSLSSIVCLLLTEKPVVMKSEYINYGQARKEGIFQVCLNKKILIQRTVYMAKRRTKIHHSGGKTKSGSLYHYRLGNLRKKSVLPEPRAIWEELELQETPPNGNWDNRDNLVGWKLGRRGTSPISKPGTDTVIIQILRLPLVCS